MTVRRAIHTLWFIAHPSDDVPGDWEAHCLEFDLISQGQSLIEALELCLESAAIHVRESLREQRDPYATRAPDEFWDLRNKVLDGGEKLSPEQFHDVVQNDGKWIIVAEFHVRIDIDFHIVDGVRTPSSEEPQPPIVWKKAA